MGKNKGGKDDVKDEPKLQAILLADSFMNAFRPITLEKPKVLLPLANVPMLDYTLEFLISSGVEEIIVFCSWHGEQVEAYINEAGWGKAVEIQCIYNPDCTCVGEALREIDQKGVIRSDPFVLISGDVISNMNLQSVIETHKQRKKEDSTAVMTIVFKQVGPTGSVRPVVDDLVVAIDSKTQQLIYYEDDVKKGSAAVPFGILLEHPELQVHSDLLDCHIDICSPEVLVAFSDNFDYQHLRRDYVRLESTNFELGNRLFAHVLTTEYAVCIHDPRTYAEVSKDIMKRWTYPIVPDNNFTRTAYQYCRGPVYREHNITLPRSVKLKKGVVLGAGVVVGENTELEDCVVGRNCVIGSNVSICSSYVWEGVVIEDNVKVKSSIICNNACVRSGAVIPRGCMISFGVIVGCSKHIPEFSCITLRARNEDDVEKNDENQDSKKDIMWDTSFVGSDGKGFHWKSEECDLGVDSDSDEGDAGGGRMSSNDSQKGKMLSCSEEEERRCERWFRYCAEDSGLEILEYMFDEDGEPISEVVQPGTKFSDGVKDMVKDGVAANVSVENLLLEIKSFKLSADRTFGECLYATVSAVLEVTNTAEPNLMTLVTNFKNQLSKWAELFKGLCTIQADQMQIIKAAEDFILGSTLKANLIPAFRFILQIIEDLDIISEEIWFEWIQSRRSEQSESCNNDVTALFIHPKTQEFVTWLEEEEEDDEDEDSNEKEESENGSNETESCDES